MGLEDIRLGVLSIIRNVVSYLHSEKVSDEVLGYGASGDIVRRFDIECEELIVSSLRKLLNDEVVIVSEESGILSFSSKPKWLAIVDPVDGSTNLAAGIPWVATSIALAPYKGNINIKDIVIAVVADVFNNIIYQYYLGTVITNGTLRRLSKPRSILLGYFEIPKAYDIVPRYWLVRGSRAALRSLGAIALDIIYVGLGRAEGLVDLRSKVRNVDIAASYIIAHTLGARGVRCDGELLLEVPINRLVRLGCIIIGYDHKYLGLLEEALRLCRLG